MSDFQLGLAGKLYYAAAGVEPTTAEIINVRDAKQSFKVGISESSSRISTFKNKKANLGEGDASFTVVYDGTDLGHVALRDAVLGGTQLALKFLGEDLSGFWGTYSLSSMDCNQPLTDGQSIDFKADLDGEPTVVEVPVP